MSECELIIPMKYLYSVDYQSQSILSLTSHEDKLEFMKEISKAQYIECAKLVTVLDLQYLSEWASLFPSKLLVFNYMNIQNLSNCDEFETLIKSKLDADWFDDFSDIKLVSIYVCFLKYLSNSYELIMKTSFIT